MIELAIALAVATVVGVAVLAHRPSDAELHEAARRERVRRQRAAWTSPDGRTVR